MQNSLAYRNPKTLKPAGLDDRRRMAIAELGLITEEGSWSSLVVGQVILKHVISEDEVASFADSIFRK